MRRSEINGARREMENQGPPVKYDRRPFCRCRLVWRLCELCKHVSKDAVPAAEFDRAHQMAVWVLLPLEVVRHAGEVGISVEGHQQGIII